MKDFTLYFLFVALELVINFSYMKTVFKFDADELIICMIASVFETIVLAGFMYFISNS